MRNEYFLNKMNSRTIQKNGCMIILASFFALFFLFADIGINVAWGVIALVVFLGIDILFHCRKMSIKLNISYILLLITAATVFVNMRNTSFLKSNPFYVFAMLLTLVLVAIMDDDIRSRQAVLKILFIGAAIVAVVPIISKLIPTFYINYIVPLLSLPSQSYVLGLLAQGYGGVVGAYVSLTANYIVIGFAISVARLIMTKKKRNWIAILYFLLALLSINRRSEILACFVVTLILLFICLGKQGRTIMIFIGIFGVIAIMLVLICIKSGLWRYTGNNRLLLTVFNLFSNGDISNGRFALYGVAWDLFCKHPLFGVGFGGFREYGSLIIPDITNVHNIYLQLLCEIGVVGTFVVLIAGSVLLNRTYISFKKARKGSDFAPKFFALFMVLYIIVLGLFDNPIFQDTFWLLLCLIIFCAHKDKRKVKEKKY